MQNVRHMYPQNYIPVHTYTYRYVKLFILLISFYKQFFIKEKEFLLNFGLKFKPDTRSSILILKFFQ